MERDIHSWSSLAQVSMKAKLGLKMEKSASLVGKETYGTEK